MGKFEDQLNFILKEETQNGQIPVFIGVVMKVHDTGKGSDERFLSVTSDKIEYYKSKSLPQHDRKHKWSELSKFARNGNRLEFYFKTSEKSEEMIRFESHEVEHILAIIKSLLFRIYSTEELDIIGFNTKDPEKLDYSTFTLLQRLTTFAEKTKCPLPINSNLSDFILHNFAHSLPNIVFTNSDELSPYIKPVFQTLFLKKDLISISIPNIKLNNESFYAYIGQILHKHYSHLTHFGVSNQIDENFGIFLDNLPKLASLSFTGTKLDSAALDKLQKKVSNDKIMSLTFNNAFADNALDFLYNKFFTEEISKNLKMINFDFSNKLNFSKILTQVSKVESISLAGVHENVSDLLNLIYEKSNKSIRMINLSQNEAKTKIPQKKFENLKRIDVNSVIFDPKTFESFIEFLNLNQPLQVIHMKNLTVDESEFHEGFKKLPNNLVELEIGQPHLNKGIIDVITSLPNLKVLILNNAFNKSENEIINYFAEKVANNNTIEKIVFVNNNIIMRPILESLLTLSKLNSLHFIKTPIKSGDFDVLNVLVGKISFYELVFENDHFDSISLLDALMETACLRSHPIRIALPYSFLKEVSKFSELTYNEAQNLKKKAFTAANIKLGGEFTVVHEGNLQQYKQENFKWSPRNPLAPLNRFEDIVYVNTNTEFPPYFNATARLILSGQIDSKTVKIVKESMPPPPSQKPRPPPRRKSQIIDPQFVDFRKSGNDDLKQFHSATKVHKRRVSLSKISDYQSNIANLHESNYTTSLNDAYSYTNSYMPKRTVSKFDDSSYGNYPAKPFGTDTGNHHFDQKKFDSVTTKFDPENDKKIISESIKKLAISEGKSSENVEVKINSEEKKSESEKISEPEKKSETESNSTEKPSNSEQNDSELENSKKLSDENKNDEKPPEIKEQKEEENLKEAKESDETKKSKDSSESDEDEKLNHVSKKKIDSSDSEEKEKEDESIPVPENLDNLKESEKKNHLKTPVNDSPPRLVVSKKRRVLSTTESESSDDEQPKKNLASISSSEPEEMEIKKSQKKMLRFDDSSSESEEKSSHRKKSVFDSKYAEEIIQNERKHLLSSSDSEEEKKNSESDKNSDEKEPKKKKVLFDSNSYSDEKHKKKQKKESSSSKEFESENKFIRKNQNVSSSSSTESFDELQTKNKKINIEDVIAPPMKEEIPESKSDSESDYSDDKEVEIKTRPLTNTKSTKRVSFIIDQPQRQPRKMSYLYNSSSDYSETLLEEEEEEINEKSDEKRQKLENSEEEEKLDDHEESKDSINEALINIVPKNTKNLLNSLNSDENKCGSLYSSDKDDINPPPRRKSINMDQEEEEQKEEEKIEQKKVSSSSSIEGLNNSESDSSSDDKENDSEENSQIEKEFLKSNEEDSRKNFVVALSDDESDPNAQNNQQNNEKSALLNKKSDSSKKHDDGSKTDHSSSNSDKHKQKKQEKKRNNKNNYSKENKQRIDDKNEVATIEFGLDDELSHEDSNLRKLLNSSSSSDEDKPENDGEPKQKSSNSSQKAKKEKSQQTIRKSTTKKQPKEEKHENVSSSDSDSDDESNLSSKLADNRNSSKSNNNSSHSSKNQSDTGSSHASTSKSSSKLPRKNSKLKKVSSKSHDEDSDKNYEDIPYSPPSFEFPIDFETIHTKVIIQEIERRTSLDQILNNLRNGH